MEQTGRKRTLRYTLLAVLVLLAMSCSLLSGGGSQTGSPSGSGTGDETSEDSQSSGAQDNLPKALQEPKVKNDTVQFKVLQTWFRMRPESSKPMVELAVLLENPDPKLAVVKWIVQPTFTDASGNELVLSNFSEGKLSSQDQVIFPGQKQLFCLMTSLDGDAADVELNFSEVKTADLGSQTNPLSPGPAVLALNPDKYSLANTIKGDVNFTVSNSLDHAVVLPSAYAAAYDSSGQLIGCGYNPFSPAFVPANGKAVAQVQLSSDGDPASVEGFISYPLVGYGDYYATPQVLKVTEVSFIQSNITLFPIYSIENTDPDLLVTDYLVNAAFYGADGQILGADGHRVMTLVPGGAKFGPYSRTGSSTYLSRDPAARVEIQVYTLLVDKKHSLPAVPASYGPASYDADARKITASVKNETDFELRISVSAACYDASGKVINFHEWSGTLAAKAEDSMEFYPYLTDQGDCSTADRIEFNPIFINTYDF